MDAELLQIVLDIADSSLTLAILLFGVVRLWQALQTITVRYLNHLEDDAKAAADCDDPPKPSTAA